MAQPNNTAGMCAGEKRIALATALAYQIGKDLGPQQLSELITFINVINAQLALLASSKQAALTAAAAQRGSLPAQQGALAEKAQMGGEIVTADEVDIPSIL